MRKKRKNAFQRFISYCEFQLSHMDYWVFWLAIALFGVGVLAVFSVNNSAIAGFNNPNNWVDRRYMFSQATYGLAGILMMLLIVLIPHKFIRKLGPVAIGVTLMLLVATLLFGEDGNDSNVRRWLSIGGFRLQPGEFARLGLIYGVAWLIYWLNAKKLYYIPMSQKFKRFLISDKVPFKRKLPYLAGSYWSVLGLVGIIAGLFVLQPDLGSAITVAGIGVVMVFTSGLPGKHVAGFVIAGVVGIAGFWLLSQFVLRGYQMDRIDVWRYPFDHPNGLQNVFGFRSIALGGLRGVGIGEATSRFGFSIEAHTDFIITIVAEELGFLAVLGVMAAYFFIAMRCFGSALKGRDLFSSMFAIGTGALFLIQPFINLGGASGFIPLTGLTLPLISFGGTSAIAIFMMVGVYLNASVEIYRDNVAIPKPETKSMKPKKARSKVIPFVKAS